jgi:excisionase family DNA binding protein
MRRKEGYMRAVKPVCKLKSLSQAADELGITVNTLRAWIYRRNIPYIKIGRCVRVSDQTIEQIIDHGTMPAREERD